MATIGYNTIAGGTDSVGTSETHILIVNAIYVYQAVAGDEVDEVFVYAVSSAIGNSVMVGLYDITDEGAGNDPDGAELVANTTITISTGTGWNSAAVSWVLTAGRVYAIALGSSVGGGTTLAQDSGSSGDSYGGTFGSTFADPWNSGSASADLPSVYANVANAGGGGGQPFPPSLHSRRIATIVRQAA